MCDLFAALTANNGGVGLAVVNWANSFVDAGGADGNYLYPTKSGEFNDAAARWREYKITYCKVRYMFSDIQYPDGQGINDTLVGTVPIETSLVAGFTNTLFAKSIDFKIHNAHGVGRKNVIEKKVAV